jgi:fibronectin type 3 domain-containing protein
MTIPAGQSVPVTLKFTPQSSGTASGQLTFRTNDPKSPAIATATGAGIGGKQHSVALAWVPSSSTVTGYNVYRGTASGSYAKLAGLLVSAAYTDASVKSGTAYFYVTTAVNSSGAESAKSNEVRVQIPTP